MNTKTILGISLAAAMVVSLTSFATAAQGDGLDITNIMIGEDAAVIKTAQSVQGNPGAYGYAIVLEDESVLAVTSHGGALDHSDQTNANDRSFHVHQLIGAEADGECDESGFPLFVDEGFEVEADLSIVGNQIEVTDADMPTDFIFPPSGLSFEITVDGTSGEVCFSPVDTFNFPP